VGAHSTPAIDLVEIRKAYGRTPVLSGVSLPVESGEFIAVLGPSGCGKTTLLRIIAGLTPLDAGAVFFHGERVDRLPAHHRRVGFVFQSYALFPHMTVVENVSFGVRHRQNGRSPVGAMLELVGLTTEAHKFPHQLSGGQQQRVALARALAIQPAVLLLDEPFSNLDLKLRQAMRLEVRRVHDQLGMTTVLVTHDQTEALTMADRVVLMTNGVIMQTGTPVDVYQRPANRFVADFVGDANFLSGIVETPIAVDRARIVLDGAAAALEARGAAPVAAGERVTVMVRPEHVSLDRSEPGGINGSVVRQVFMGAVVRCWVEIGEGVRVIVDAPGGGQPQWPTGAPVQIKVDPERLWYLRQ